jgi:hypothetical protein
MNTTATHTTTSVHVALAVASLTAVLTLAGLESAPASAIPNIPDPAPTARSCDPVRDGECNLTLRHLQLDVSWWSKLA